MWRHLNVRDTIHKIGNAVAPPLEEDEDIDSQDEEYYLEEEDEDGDEDYLSDGEQHPEEPRPALGFAGLLSRALDSQQRQHEQQETDEECSEELDDTERTDGELYDLEIVPQTLPDAAVEATPTSATTHHDSHNISHAALENTPAHTSETLDASDNGSARSLTGRATETPSPVRPFRPLERERGSVTPVSERSRTRSRGNSTASLSNAPDSVQDGSEHGQHSLDNNSLRSIPEFTAAPPSGTLHASVTSVASTSYTHQTSSSTVVDPLLGSTTSILPDDNSSSSRLENSTSSHQRRRAQRQPPPDVVPSATFNRPPSTNNPTGPETAFAHAAFQNCHPTEATSTRQKLTGHLPRAHGAVQPLSNSSRPRPKSRNGSNSSNNGSGHIRLAAIPILEDSDETPTTALTHNPSDANDKPPRSPRQRMREHVVVIGKDADKSDVSNTGDTGDNEIKSLVVEHERELAKQVSSSGEGNSRLLESLNASVEASKHTVSTQDGKDQHQIDVLEHRCRVLEQSLKQAEDRVIILQQDARQRFEQDENKQQSQMMAFSEKEARLLQAAAEDHEHEMRQLRHAQELQVQSLQHSFAEEREAADKARQQLHQLLEDANARADEAERESYETKQYQEKSRTQQEQQEVRALRRAEDKLVQALAQLDERDESIRTLKTSLAEMKSAADEQQHASQEAEEELEELHEENENMRHHVSTMESEMKVLREKVANLQSDADSLSHVKMELRMLQEDRDRDRAKNESVAINAESSTAQLETERDAAKAEARDLKQQLVAGLADLEVVRADYDRVILSNSNLQNALESFQNEREAERSIMEDQRRAQEDATAAAHAAALDAIRQVHEARIHEIQHTADSAVQKSIQQVRGLEVKLEQYRIDNVQMRRSLDEAIIRLQSNQEDVIDRSLMKNILLDWLSKTQSKEKRQVLEVMASVLHFSDEEKEKVHITDQAGRFGRVVETFTAPLPPPKADMQKLEGDNVRDKWVNFLLAETED